MAAMPRFGDMSILSQGKSSCKGPEEGMGLEKFAFFFYLFSLLLLVIVLSGGFEKLNIVFLNCFFQLNG